MNFIEKDLYLHIICSSKTPCRVKAGFLRWEALAFLGGGQLHK